MSRWLRPGVGVLSQRAAAPLAPSGTRRPPWHRSRTALLPSVPTEEGRCNGIVRHVLKWAVLSGTRVSHAHAHTTRTRNERTGVGLGACSFVYIARRFHPPSCNPIAMIGRVILLFSSFHIFLLSLLSSVNCVSQFKTIYFSFSWFCRMPSVDSTGIHTCIQNKV